MSAAWSIATGLVMLLVASPIILWILGPMSASDVIDAIDMLRAS